MAYYHDYVAGMLREGTKAVVAMLVSADAERYAPRTAQEAHRWVRRGYPHSTGLWLDIAGRIRNARGE